MTVAALKKFLTDLNDCLGGAENDLGTYPIPLEEKDHHHLFASSTIRADFVMMDVPMTLTLQCRPAGEKLELQQYALAVRIAGLTEIVALQGWRIDMDEPRAFNDAVTMPLALPPLAWKRLEKALSAFALKRYYRNAQERRDDAFTEASFAFISHLRNCVKHARRESQRLEKEHKERNKRPRTKSGRWVKTTNKE